MELTELVERARKARQNAYCPYSRYPVGAALLAESGACYVGANCENAAFGAGICAERAALAAAVTAGERRFTALAVVSSPPAGSEPATPCGICRQMLAEFGEMTIICAGDGDVWRRTTLTALLPAAFSPAHLTEI